MEVEQALDMEKQRLAEEQSQKEQQEKEKKLKE
jgi:hypothetical protein